MMRGKGSGGGRRRAKGGEGGGDVRHFTFGEEFCLKSPPSGKYGFK